MLSAIPKKKGHGRLGKQPVAIKNKRPWWGGQKPLAPMRIPFPVLVWETTKLRDLKVQQSLEQASTSHPQPKINANLDVKIIMQKEGSQYYNNTTYCCKKDWGVEDEASHKNYADPVLAACIIKLQQTYYPVPWRREKYGAALDSMIDDYVRVSS